MSDRDAKIAELKRLRKIEEVKRLRAAAAAEPPKELEPSAVESAARGAAQGASMGFADELVGLGEGTARFLQDEDAKGLDGWKDAYAKSRDESRANFDKAAAAHPVAYGGGALAGGIATAFVPGLGALNAAKGASTATRLGLMAAQGALGGAGTSTASVDTPEFAGDVALGAGLGAATEGAIQAAKPALKTAGRSVSDFVRGKVAPVLGDVAEKRAFKAAVGNQGKAYRDAVAQGRVNAIGRTVLDSGTVKPADVVNPLRTPARAIADRAGDKAAAAWEDIEKVFAQIDEAHPDGIVEPKDIAFPLLDRADEIRSPNTHAEVANLERQASEYVNKTPLSMSETQRLKNTYKFNPQDPFNVASTGKKAIAEAQENAVERFAAQAAEAVPAVEEQFDQVLQTGSGRPVSAPASSPVLREARAAEAAVDPTAALAKYREGKKLYGDLITADRAAEELATRQAKNRTFSLTDNIVGAAKAAADQVANHGAVGATLKGFGAALANKAMRERGSAATALVADKLSKVLREAPGRLGPYASVLANAARRGEQSLAVTHHLLMRDPDYRALFANPDQEGKPSP